MEVHILKALELVMPCVSVFLLLHPHDFDLRIDDPLVMVSVPQSQTHFHSFWPFLEVPQSSITTRDPYLIPSMFIGI